MATDSLTVTATEVADFVFCQHSWSLRRAGVRMSNEAMVRMAAGEDFQAQKDASVLTAVEGRDQAKRAARQALGAGLFLLLMLGLWVYLSFLRQ